MMWCPVCQKTVITDRMRIWPKSPTIVYCTQCRICLELRDEYCLEDITDEEE